MQFLDVEKKGISRYSLDADVEGEPLRVHISEVDAGERSHPPHRHGGYEAFYILDGEGTLEIDGERHPLRANEAVVFDPRKLHGLVNTSDAPVRYMVIIRPEEDDA